MENVLLSVWCITYNHGKYIEDAIKGFLSQITDFDFEIVVHDDASTDETTNIITRYQQEYPEKIRTIIQKENLYSKSSKNWHGRKAIMEKELKGKYIAVCEGDDFWLDAHKLQIQVDYMEAHPECIMTVHDAVICNCLDGSVKDMAPYNCEKDISAEELIMWYNGNTPTASMVYRREVLDINGFFVNMHGGDWALELYSITKGRVHYFDRIMSCYRANADNSFTQREWGNIKRRIEIRIGQMFFLRQYNDYTQKKYEKFIIIKMNEILQSLLDECSDMAIDEFNQTCKKMLDMQMCDDKLISKLQELYIEGRSADYCRPSIAAYIKRFKHILIMGAGYWGQQLAQRIVKNDLDFSGFVVSDGQEHPKEIMNKVIWEISSIPFKKDVGIIIAVRVGLYSEIVEMMHEHGITEFIYFYDLLE